MVDCFHFVSAWLAVKLNHMNLGLLKGGKVGFESEFSWRILCYIQRRVKLNWGAPGAVNVRVPPLQQQLANAWGGGGGRQFVNISSSFSDVAFINHQFIYFAQNPCLSSHPLFSADSKWPILFETVTMLTKAKTYHHHWSAMLLAQILHVICQFFNQKGSIQDIKRQAVIISSSSVRPQSC